MNNPPKQVQIDDPHFRQAVQLMDDGQAEQLQQWLHDHPQLLTQTAAEDGQFAGDYFASPRLLWFVAENPIRRRQLPANVVEVIDVVVTASLAAGINDLPEVLNYTLALVASGCVARESGHQAAMCRALVRHGADPNSGMQSSLAHREIAACEALLACGADLTLPVAAGLGRDDDVRIMTGGASPALRQEALVMAAINGQSQAVALLGDTVADLNAFNPPGLHAHSTPLHQAVASGSADTVTALLRLGADGLIRDRVFDGTAADWARECGHPQIAQLLERPDH